MKLVITDNRVLMTILVIASVGGTLAAVQGGIGLINIDSQTPLSPGGSMLTGNIKVIQYDENGNIKAYRQTDNHIVKEGMEVIMAQVFRGINASSNYPNATIGLPHPVQYMQIGTGGQFRLLHNNTDIFLPLAGCDRGTGASITNSTPAHGYHTLPGLCDDGANLCSAQMNVTAIQSFSGASCSALSIDEAGIYDNATATTSGMTNSGYGGNGGGYMFARNNFGSVDLGMLDTLQLQWEFTFTDS